MLTDGRAADDRQPYHHGNLRRALIDVGLELTRVGGARALVLRTVTQRAGVSPNAAYRHFADRESLLGAVASKIQEAMAERMRALESPGRLAGRPVLSPPVSAGTAPVAATPVSAESRLADTPARQRLRAVGLGYIEFALDEPGWFDVAFAGPGALPAAVDTSLPEPAGAASAAPAPPLALLISALDGLVETGELAPAARPGAEWPCWSAVHGFALLALTGPLRAVGRGEVWRSAERTVDAIIAGLLV